MMPGMNMNPKQMKRMMRQMGMDMNEVDATEVVIKTASGDIIVKNPQVMRMKMRGQETFQISGDVAEAGGTAEVEVSEDDVNMVMEQTGVSREKAEEALKSAGGDLAKAILELEEE